MAELNDEIIGVIQGSIKAVTLHISPKNHLAKVGYVLGLRVAPRHRRKGIALSLVHHMEEWFISHQVEYAYMATEKDNQASINLFVNKLGYVKFRTPVILVHPVINRSFRLSSSVEIMKLKIDQAEFLYRKFMSSTEFFPHDINRILRNKLSLGTWVAYDHRESSNGEFGLDGGIPNSWAMMSVWRSTEVIKLRVGKPTLSCMLYAKSSRMMERVLPCFGMLPSLPDFSENPFGFYFIYGVYHEGPSSGKLVRTLCKFAHNLAADSDRDGDCKVIVTEVGGCDELKLHIPHWKLLSCPEDLWCIKALKFYEDTKTTLINELTKASSSKSKPLFVDPREV